MFQGSMAICQHSSRQTEQVPASCRRAAGARSGSRAGLILSIEANSVGYEFDAKTVVSELSA